MPPTLEQRLRWRERPTKRPVLFQTWKNLLFTHWEAPAEVLQASLPLGLMLDTFEGRAFVGITPFFMRRAHPRRMPPLPWISYFLEMNVRTYVHDLAGNPGIWFYALDCNQPLAVWLARAGIGLPYEHARMRATRAGSGMIEYHSRRARDGAEASFSYRLAETSKLAEPGSLEFFLIERYLLFTARRGRLFRSQVHHPPYPIVAADLSSHEITGFTPHWPDYASPPVHLAGTPELTVEIFAPERC